MGIGVQVTFDAHDPARLAGFWAAALGYEVEPPPPGFSSWEQVGEHLGLPREQWDAFSAVVDPDGAGPRVFFQRVTEGKSAKNRMHLDVNISRRGSPPSDAAAARARISEHVTALEELGAAVLYENDQPHGYCVVMTDPEGNEFCVQ
ncbi:VOC family protein [Salinifilum ghardaiensis]